MINVRTNINDKNSFLFCSGVSAYVMIISIDEKYAEKYDKTDFNECCPEPWQIKESGFLFRNKEWLQER